MERSSVAIEGVGLCGDSIRVGDGAFRSLVQVTLDILLKKKSDDSLASNPVSIGSLPHLFQLPGLCSARMISWLR